MAVDRDRVLEAIDLPTLADEFLGPRRGRGRSASWRCPTHSPQTGKTPPVSVYVGGAGHQRWHCHACGADGTAVDLLIATTGLSVRDALAELAHRAGLPTDAPAPSRPPQRPSRAPPPAPGPLRPPSPLLARYVTACETHLRADDSPVRDWLAARGFSDAVLRANRVGADPGPRRLTRPPGLPRAGPAAVFPVYDQHGQLTYLQARYLDPDRVGRKYDNPTSEVAENPRVGLLHRRAPLLPPRVPGVVVVCEGIPDALAAADAGFAAAAVMGAALPDERTAHRLLTLTGEARLAVAFDSDERGQAGAERLLNALERVGAPERGVRVPVPAPDVNEWSRNERATFPAALANSLTAALPDHQATPVAPQRVIEQDSSPSLTIGL